MTLTTSSAQPSTRARSSMRLCRQGLSLVWPTTLEAEVFFTLSLQRLTISVVIRKELGISKSPANWAVLCRNRRPLPLLLLDSFYSPIKRLRTSSQRIRGRKLLISCSTAISTSISQRDPRPKMVHQPALPSPLLFCLLLCSNRLSRT